MNNEFFSTLTLTGVLATLLSLFFAFAAFFVQRKGRQASNRKMANKEATDDVLDAHHVPRLPAVEQLLNPTYTNQQEPAVASQTHQDHADAKKESLISEPPKAPAAPAGNYFKKYTPAGGDQEVIHHADSDEYAWE